ncbi:hypothetical protein CJD38_17485 [Stenotrophobium rhamnosiphilum]|uniref:DUF2542 family protein n=1 Tax=Stenotrophobium rhamnosiphilum TaxID=2029166 RepID=A0A2T5MBM1_9GAMM|nr:hypothetical protein CJD38_17485 [Stenotrophobium rhamnosiphilum]
MNLLAALAASLVLIVLGLRCLKDVSRARKSGVGNFILQWPNNFERSQQPAAFWWCIFLYTAVGYISFVIAAFLMAQLFL